jgi:hypothetical protein
VQMVNWLTDGDSGFTIRERCTWCQRVDPKTLTIRADGAHGELVDGW